MATALPVAKYPAFYRTADKQQILPAGTELPDVGNAANLRLLQASGCAASMCHRYHAKGHVALGVALGEALG